MPGVRRFQFPEEPLLTVDEVAHYLNLTPAAIHQRRYRGDFPPAISIGRSLRWRRSDIEQWINEGLGLDV